MMGGLFQGVLGNDLVPVGRVGEDLGESKVLAPRSWRRCQGLSQNQCSDPPGLSGAGFGDIPGCFNNSLTPLHRVGDYSRGGKSSVQPLCG